jgi:hypothetical protein
MSAKKRLGFSATKRIKKAKANWEKSESAYLASQWFHRELTEQSLWLLEA